MYYYFQYMGFLPPELNLFMTIFIIFDIMLNWINLLISFLNYC